MLISNRFFYSHLEVPFQKKDLLEIESLRKMGLKRKTDKE